MQHIHGGDVYRYRNYLDFSSNCNPLGTPEGVKQALVYAAGQVGNYPDVKCEKLKEALSGYEQLEAEQIICGNGAAEVIFSLCQAKRPQKAMLLVPTFAEYEQALKSTGCEIVYYTMREQTGFALEEDFTETLLREKPDILFICNPNNPTGVLTEKDWLTCILDMCVRLECLLVLDECFLDFVERPKKYSMKAYLGEYRNLFLLKAFTKRYAMAGVRLGYGLCSDLSLLERMKTVTQPWNVSVLAQEAGIAALKESEYVNAGRNLVFQERKYLKAELSVLQYKVYASEANYIFFRGPAGLAEKMKRHRILIRDCSNYRGLTEGYYRVAVRTHEENVRLVEALQKESTER